MPVRVNEDPSYGDKRLLNAAIIGFMVGTYEVMGRGSQAVINMAGRYVGREVMKFARDKGQEIRSMEDFSRFVKEQGLAGQFDFLHEATRTEVRIGDCGTCPKKVGHYQYDGSTCPWGGMLAGIMEEITGEEYSTAARLTPGVSCTIQVHPAN